MICTEKREERFHVMVDGESVGSSVNQLVAAHEAEQRFIAEANRLRCQPVEGHC